MFPRNAICISHRTSLWQWVFLILCFPTFSVRYARLFYNGGFMSERYIHRFPWGENEEPQILIIHFGSKSTPLIAQLLREIGFKSVMVRANEADRYLSKRHMTQRLPKLVILSGGDKSVYDADAPTYPEGVFKHLLQEGKVVFFGICYGAQLLAQLRGGIVERAVKPEYGIVDVKVNGGFGLYRGGRAVMNHGDEITKLPLGAETIASTDRCHNAFFGGSSVYGIQFHPEMDHTEDGEAILMHVASIAGCKQDYEFHPKEFVKEAAAWMGSTCQTEGVLCGLSGGVDSSVAFRIAQGVIQEANLLAVYVDNGFMRLRETEEVRTMFGEKQVVYVNAGELFYDAIDCISYPEIGTIPEREGAYYEAVRKCIGATFIDVFTSTVRSSAHKTKFLIQGTNAADIIESQTGLKSHHNVALPEKLGLDIVEPLAGLYKFEIRRLAREGVHLPPDVADRQPFPGPGLAIRTWGKLDRSYVPPLQAANAVLEDCVAAHKQDLPGLCQYYVALAPLPSTGLMGDARVLGFAWIIRMVTAKNRESYSTLDVSHPPKEFIDLVSHRLTSEIRMHDGTRFCRVYYEWTGKPPSTTEPH